MASRNFIIGVVVTLFLAITSAAVYIGNLNGRVSALESQEVFEKTKKEILSEIKNKAQGLKNQMDISMPIGSIIDYVGPVESRGGDPQDRLKNGYMVWAKDRPNWAVCNGATLAEGTYDSTLADSDKNGIRGFQLPNLLDSFTKGVSIDEIGTLGGNKNDTLDIRHSHAISPCGDATGSNALHVPDGSWHPHVFNCNERARGTTEIDSLTRIINNEPQYFGVLKIMRIR